MEGLHGGGADDNGFMEYVKTDIIKPRSTDVENLSQWKKEVTKVRIIIMEEVRDNIVSNLHGKETPFIMWKAVTNLFENSSDHRKLALKGKLQNFKIQKNDTIL